MCKTTIPPLSPSHDGTVYLVLDDFGQLGRAYRETDPAEADRLLDGLGLTKRDAQGLRLLPDGRPMQIVVETPGDEQQQTAVACVYHRMNTLREHR